MQIIELTGVPCSGKTNLANQLCKDPRFQLFTPALAVFASKPNESAIGGQFMGVLGRLKLQLIGFLSLGPALTFRILRSNSLLGVMSSLRITLNVLQKIGIAKHVAGCTGDRNVLIVDEGVAHIGFNLSYSDQQLVSELLTMFNYNFLLINCQAEEELVKRRMLERGHWRVSNNQKEIDSFLEENRKKEAQLDSLFGELLPEHKYLRIDASEDIEIIIQKVLAYLEK